ncbi:hypothetical protein T492DRAFT_1059809 [Pavlovales sp. CCMP2436]|nr:hypothetical protein T492DRAFT_1059809 [Pavlovales sp. CCMP2436]
MASSMGRGKKAVQEKLPPHHPNAVEVAVRVVGGTKDYNQTKFREANPQTLDAFYTAYENLRKKFPLLKPDTIYTMDETGFEPDLPSNKVVGATGSKSAYHRRGDTQQHVVVVFDNHPGTRPRMTLTRAGSSCRT